MGDGGGSGARGGVWGPIVTTWGPVGVARFVREAGFTGSHLLDAVALVLAASGGRDHYALNVTSVPGSERRGLFALRVDEVPPTVVECLFTPSVNAEAAAELHAQCGESFGWHPVWIAGAAANLRPMVEVSLAAGAGAKGARAVSPFVERLHNLASLAEAIRSGQTGDRVSDGI